MVDLKWSELAINDLEEIISYISSDSEDHAKLFAAKIIRAVEKTSVFPYSGRVVPELNNEQIRENIVQNIRVIYRIKDNTMEVIRVLHSARDFPKLNK